MFLKDYKKTEKRGLTTISSHSICWGAVWGGIENKRDKGPLKTRWNSTEQPRLKFFLRERIQKHYQFLFTTHLWFIFLRYSSLEKSASRAAITALSIRLTSVHAFSHSLVPSCVNRQTKSRDYNKTFISNSKNIIHQGRQHSCGESRGDNEINNWAMLSSFQF